MLVVLGALALAGCGGSSAASKPTATSTATPDAATILAAAKNAQTSYQDIEFSMTMAFTASGSTINGTFTGTQTTSPKRSDIMMNFTTAGQQFAGEVISDVATNTTYTELTSPVIPGYPSGKWVKSTGSSAFIPIDPSTFSNLSGLTGVTLKGSETLDGIQVWHFQASESTGNTTGQADVYIRQDNNQLYEFVAHVTGTDSGTITFKITGVNTGKTITLPPASQVVSQ
jgi:hypothetical protein